MHETKIGKFERLAVKIHSKETLPAEFIFYDKENEIQKWIEEGSVKGPEYTGLYFILKDLNYLLNAIMKNINGS